jgi:hypothetical protein
MAAETNIFGDGLYNSRQSRDRTKNYLELPLPIEFKRPPSTGRIELVM